MRDADAEAPDPQWRQRWPALAELGVTGVCVAEEHGGFGMRVDAAAAVAGELGAALHGSPYAGVVAAAHALGAAGDEESRGLLADVLSGRSLCALGRLRADGGGGRLVDGAPGADALLLLDAATGTALLAGPGGWSAGATHDFDVSRRCADVEIDAARARRIPASAAGALHRLLLAADAAGCVRRMLDRTVGYARTRQAFGRAIGGYQAVQHRLVDHGVRARGMSLLVAEAARALGAADADADRLVAVAELSVSAGATHIVHDLAQLTGGIAFTWEYGLHFHDRRVHHDARLGGNPRSAVRAVAAAQGWLDAR